MKKLFTVALLFLSLGVFSQQLPSRQPEQLPSRYPHMLSSRAYQQPKVKFRGDKVVIIMSKQQYLEMERRKQKMVQHRMRAPFRPKF
jgi:hypothetical protein